MKATLAACWCALALGASACAGITDARASGDPPGTGAALVTQAFVGLAAWSPDGSTLYFTNQDGTADASVNAVDLASRSTRRLASLRALNTGGEAVAMSADPGVLYFSVARTDAPIGIAYGMYRVPTAGGAIDTLATDAAWPWFAISADGTHLAYNGPAMFSDTLRVLTLAGGRVTSRKSVATGLSLPRALALSPDGAGLVYGDGFLDVHVVSIGATAGGEARQLWRGPAVGSRDSAAVPANNVLWSAGVPRLLVADWNSGTRAVAIADVDGATGARTPVAVIEQTRWAPWNLARSADGRSFAAWVPMDSVDQWMERTVYRFRLYVQTPRTGKPVAALEWRADEPLYWIDFSPDGRRLAFALYGRLYLLDME